MSAQKAASCGRGTLPAGSLVAGSRTDLDRADHFSAVAGAYARFRPRYPAALFEWLRKLAPGRTLAWDCATGSGQAALGLAHHFERILATDASAAQLAHATAHPRIRYAAARAEQSPLCTGAAQLVTVAQALHWLDVERFYAEAARVLVPGGVLAVWCYQQPRVEPSAAGRAVERFHDQVVGPYWPPERRLVEEGYRSLPFPYPELAVPGFEIHARLSARELEGYLRTWSATQRYVSAHGEDPVAALGLTGHVRGPLDLRWPVSLRAGRKPPPA